MGVESTYDDDGYREETDDHSSGPTADLKTKPHDSAVINLDSSPEKSSRRDVEMVEKSNKAELQTKCEKESSQEEGFSEVPPKSKDNHADEEAVDDSVVPTDKKKDVPNDEKDDIIEKSASSDVISRTENIKDLRSDQSSNNLYFHLKDQNEVNDAEHNTTKDSKAESTDFTDEKDVHNSQNIDLKELIDIEPESKSSRINKRRRSSSLSIEDNEVIPNSKQNSSPNNQDEALPAKKLKAELDTIFPKHNKALTDYIKKTSNETVDNITSHINQLIVDIQTLNDMIKANENEWNNMIYLKKMKEEICIRLTRKKQTIQLESKKIGDISELFTDLTSEEMLIPKNDEIDKQRGPQLSSTPLNNKSSSANNQNLTEQVSNILDGFDVNSKSFSQSAANMLIQNRANMKSSELAKEKLNMQKVHRLVNLYLF